MSTTIQPASPARDEIAGAPARDDKKQPRIHLGYLDGFRGILALAVLLFHTEYELCRKMRSPVLHGVLKFAYLVFDTGHYAVVAFIVLSGYVLMLPVVKSETGEPKGGLGGFFYRRAVRILPTYYGALVFFLLLRVVAKAAKMSAAFQPVSPLDIAAHALLIHNVFPFYRNAIDSPMWSLATEWQIYFVFALILLPVYRSFGIKKSVALAVVLSLIPVMLFPHFNFNNFCPWFIAMYAFGMYAAYINFRRDNPAQQSNANTGKLILALVAAFAVCRYIPPVEQFIAHHDPVATIAMDFLVGSLASAVIVYCTRALQIASAEGRDNFFLKLCQSRFAMLVGGFSYSLYLIHQPLIGILIVLLMKFHLPPFLFVPMTYLCLPILVCVTYLFYLAFEKPSLNLLKGRGGA